MATTIQDVVHYVLKTPHNTNKAILTAMLEDLAGSNPDGIIQLRRDNDFNYAKVGDTFIPANGEICLVDTARNGLRAKCGDGVSTWNQLGYIDEYIVKGYYADGKFYRDPSHREVVSGADQKIYIDIPERLIYFYDQGEFLTVNGAGLQVIATEETPGIMKLYQSTGENTDGTMTQKAISQQLSGFSSDLDEKIEATFNTEEEMLILSTDLFN